jgi:quercetin dioxygenase-like cupin family protein
MGILNPGITPANSGDGGTVWNILGMPGTFVPAHIHPTQDEFIYLLDGEMELTLDGTKHALHTGEMARMPMGIPHAYANSGTTLVRALFWVTPARKLHELFSRLHDLTDVAEVVRISAECEVNFLLPPG